MNRWPIWVSRLVLPQKTLQRPKGRPRQSAKPSPKWEAAVTSILLVAGCGGDGKSSEKRHISVMTALPLFADSNAEIRDVLKGPDQRSAIIRTMAARDTVVALDSIDADVLARTQILILAQPRALAPQELVAIDTWVRNGGRALIFSDPELLWPSDLPLGDRRRAPPVGLLDPLFKHWGLVLKSAQMTDAGPASVAAFGNEQMAVAWPGRWTATGSGCRVAADGLIAECQIGKGRALLVGDADMLDERLWDESGIDNKAAILSLVNRLAVWTND